MVDTFEPARGTPQVAAIAVGSGGTPRVTAVTAGGSGSTPRFATGAGRSVGTPWPADVAASPEEDMVAAETCCLTVGGQKLGVKK